MKQIIVTGFQPFGPYKFNPVEESTQYFHGKKIDEYNIIGVVLPCTYFGAFQILKNAILKINPDTIISTGLSSGVKGIRFETTGRNIMNGKYADADGYSPNNVPIIEGEREFYNTNSPNNTLANILHNEGIPTEMSANADGFICNALIYLTSHYLQTSKLNIKNTFIHVPWTDNYKDKIDLEPHKIMISRDILYHSIETIIKNVSKK
jgi:pyroglutamyl-peptidase